jgi:hypothetical protein
MPLKLIDLKRLHDKAYISGQTNRERASDDLVFYWVTHWDDTLLQDIQMDYRGEFDMIRSAGKQILADLASNPIQNDFESINDTPDEVSDLADGLYRRDANHNTSLEAFAVAEQESVVCGVGAWIIETKYQSNKTGNKKQRIVRRPVYEANNNGFWDPNAKRIDKSDADYFSHLNAYSEDGYKKLVKDLTGEEPEIVSPSSFKTPEQSFTFPWIGGEGKKIYVVEFYHRSKVKEKLLTMSDPFGDTTTLRESALKNVMDEMLDAGYEIVDEKTVDAWEVRKYIASGAEILNGEMVDGERAGERIAGEHIPVVPEYGERAIVEGEEVYEGVTKLAKDPQRMRDFAYSYLTDMFSRSPREKPIFFQEQIAGFEHMYTMSGAENNYPYLLQNRLSADGSELPIGQVATMPNVNIPPALTAAIELSAGAIREVANPGLPQDIADPDTSGKAVLALQARLDMQSMIYQEHKKFAIRRDGEIYISMASEIYDIPGKEKIELPDGTKKEVEIMKSVIDQQTGEVVILNDLRMAEFEVTSRITASYTSQKEQTLDRLETVLAGMAPDDPMRKAMQLKLIQLADGVEMEDLKEYANKQLVLSGIKTPETEEEIALLKQAQSQPPQPDAAMVLAKAEELKGQADVMEVKRKGVELNLNDENEKAKHQIEVFKAQTERMKVQIEAQKAGAVIRKSDIESVGTQLDNAGKVIQLKTPKKIEDMADEELFNQIKMG